MAYGFAYDPESRKVYPNAMIGWPAMLTTPILVATPQSYAVQNEATGMTIACDAKDQQINTWQ